MNDRSSTVRKLKHPAYCPDGVLRDASTERRINQLLRETFRSEAGRKTLDYLKSITLSSVHQASVSNDILRHAEGARWLVGLIVTRNQDAIEGKPNVLD